MLASEEKLSIPKNIDEQTSTEQDLKIDQFINKHKQSEAKTTEPQADEQSSKSDKLTNTKISTISSSQEGENSSLTESFAKVMIKNRNYSKALEIITNLSLNNPEKSIYFADQIRFLQKLIINENKQ